MKDKILKLLKSPNLDDNKIALEFLKPYTLEDIISWGFIEDEGGRLHYFARSGIQVSSTIFVVNGSLRAYLDSGEIIFWENSTDIKPSGWKAVKL